MTPIIVCELLYLNNRGARVKDWDGCGDPYFYCTNEAV